MTHNRKARVPQALVQQLKPGGRMIIPVGPNGGEQFLMRVEKERDGRVTEHKLMSVRYVPLVER